MMTMTRIEQFPMVGMGVPPVRRARTRGLSASDNPPRIGRDIPSSLTHVRPDGRDAHPYRKDWLALRLGGEACGVAATEGNLNNQLGVPLTLTRLDPARHRFAVVEAGISLPGEMRSLADMIEPDVALITLVAPAHTQDLGGI